MTISRFQTLFTLCLVAVLVAGCGSPRKSTRTSTASGTPPYSGGGYYKDDGPGRDIPANIANLPDAVPRIEPHNNANFRPYTVMGQRFVPISATTPLRQRGVASWYGRKFHGQKTANGETYDMYAMTAAHPTLPLPSYARVTHVQSGRSTIVRVNDRGPFLRGRVIDLSYAAAAKLGIIGQGSDVVEVEAITHADIRQGLNMAATPQAPTVAVVTAPPPSSAPTPQTAAVAPATNDTSSASEASTPDALAVLDQQTLSALQEESPAPAPSSTADAGTGIYLQFGAFGNPDSAYQLTDRLNGEIAHVEARQAYIDSQSNLHRVRIGPYTSRTEAVNAAVRIQEVTGMQPAMAHR